MLEVKTIVKDDDTYDRFIRLYDKAFPANERVPLVDMISHPEDTEMIGFYDQGQFCGFYAALIWKDILNILFFAVEPHLRNKGYGSQMMHWIIENHPNHRIIVDVETPQTNVSNYQQRIERKHFYYKNNFKDSEVAYKWKGTDYQIMVYGDEITIKDFTAFYRHLDRKRQNDM